VVLFNFVDVDEPAPLYLLVAVVLLAVFVYGVGLVERSVYVVVPHLVEATCVDGDVAYIVSNSVVYAWSLNGTLLGSAWVLGPAVECLAIDGRVYLLTMENIYLLDRDLREIISAKLEGVVFGALRVPWRAENRFMAFRGDRLYIAYYGGGEVFIETRDVNTLRLLDVYRQPQERYMRWGLARGDGVVAYGMRDHHLVLIDVERLENRTIPLDYRGFPLLLSLGGRLYLASGSVVTWLDGNVSRSFPGGVKYLDTDGRYIYVAYYARPLPRLAKLTPELDVVAEAAVGYLLDAFIKDGVLYLTKQGRLVELPRFNTEIGIDVIKLGNYTPGDAVFCYLPASAEFIWLGVGGFEAADCCCLHIRGLIPGWHTFNVLSSGDLTIQLLITGGMLKWELISPTEIKQSYVVYVEPGKTLYLADMDPAALYIIALLGLIAYLPTKIPKQPYED